jgi:glutamyl-tRNA reductase
MSILLVGLNHRTAPVELREQFSFTGCGLQMALEDLHIQNRPGQSNPPAALHEAVILSTCNRLEIYAVVAGGAARGQAIVEDFLAHLQGIESNRLRPHLYAMEEASAVEHLMQVAAGLDSLILGEPQILGQVTQAFSDAQAAAKTGPILSHLFASAVHAGKRARTETAISRHTTSVSHAAALLAQEEIGDLRQAHTLIVGAGEMAELAAQAMHMHGAQDITCINRTYSKAEELANQVGGRALNWYHLSEALTWADVVLSATGAPHTVIYAADVDQILPHRGGRPLIFIDIAVPRDVEENVEELPTVQRFDIDDLEITLDANLAQRQAAIPQVQAIVSAEAADFMEWLQYRQVARVIADLRQKAEALAEAEIEQALQRLPGLSEHEQKVVTLLAHRIVNKLLHEPTVRLKSRAASGNGYSYAHAVRELFMLGESGERPNGGGEAQSLALCDLQRTVEPPGEQK